MYDSIVTGAAGFIGSTLAERLLADGERVLGIDSFDPYYPAQLKRRNLARALENSRYAFREADLVAFRLDRCLDRNTRIYHFAGQPGVRGSWGPQFGQYVTNNILATQALLERVVRAGHPTRLVYASSSSVYGQQPRGAMGEEVLPNPISPYGMTKLAAEHLMRSYAGAHELPLVALRFFTVYGPRQRPDMAFHRFFRWASTGAPIEILGTGRQLRDFTYVDDIVEGMHRAAVTDRAVGIYNLGRGAPVPLMTAVGHIRRITGTKSPIQRFDRPKGDPDVTWADTRRATKDFGYAPRVDIEEGLRRQWSWQQELLRPRSR